ncbi:unnamed protein product [Durusdinium trenchii]|uniref:Major facilitator superfamily (MFS) profile domain-containing protein n=2 Tax=Durusdinium trenchii TaxID=1381693 RepID=A0ABP0MVB4_9DINO
MIARPMALTPATPLSRQALRPDHGRSIHAGSSCWRGSAYTDPGFLRAPGHAAGHTFATSVVAAAMARARHRHRRVKAQPVSAEGAATTTTSHRRYFHFILLSTAVRSFEAGVVASMMPSIRQGLQLSYTSQGNVAGSPDYGIVPSGLLAMAIFKRFSPFVVLTSGYFIISAVSVCCALLPSLPTLVAARAIGGLCWGLAAVHYPTWVNRYGPAEQRTLWMAGINAMLLTGIVSGYVLGGLARATGAARWESLYLLEALLMFSCALLGSRFEPSVVQVEPAPASKAEKSDVTGERSFFPKELVALGRSGLFLSTLAAGCFQSGAVGFMLYFITQALAAIFHWSPRIIYICVSLVITVGPIGGIVLGAAYLNRAGGYQNYRRAHQMSATCAILSLLCGCCMLAGGSPWIYGLANLGLLLFGAAPTAAINGIAVSCVPEAKHFASATQFAAQNLAKLLIPLVGGIVIDHLGLVRGYHVVTVGALLCYAVSSLIAFFQAKAREEMATAA